SLPALTSSASCGASLKLLGTRAGSVTTSAPSSLPMSEAPTLGCWAKPDRTPRGIWLAGMASAPMRRRARRERRGRGGARGALGVVHGISFGLTEFDDMHRHGVGGAGGG